MLYSGLSQKPHISIACSNLVVENYFLNHLPFLLHFCTLGDSS